MSQKEQWWFALLADCLGLMVRFFDYAVKASAALLLANKEDPMFTKLIDSALHWMARRVLNLIGATFQSSAGYSILGKNFDGKILLWNKGVWLLCDYELEKARH